jgi:hypothetical protein
MRCRFSGFALALLVALNLCNTTYGQAQATTQAAAPAAAKARWPTPLKGEGTIEIIRGNSHRVGKEMVTVIKIKNTSKAPLALLTVEEYWYNAAGATVSGDTYRHKPLLNPGEIIEVTTKSPWTADMNRNLHMFKHVNGKLDVKQVKKFQE